MTTFFDIETLGLNPYQSRVVLIQLSHAGNIQLWKGWKLGEPEMIDGFLSALDSLPKNEVVAGFNILKFDLPFIAGRLAIHHRMDCPTHRRLYDRHWFDLFQFLGGEYRSMDYWISRYGIKRDCPYTGRDIPLLFERGAYDKVEAHGVEDLMLCELLYGRLLRVGVSH
jgi:RNase_H superfamily